MTVAIDWQIHQHWIGRACKSLCNSHYNFLQWAGTHWQCYQPYLACLRSTCMVINNSYISEFVSVL